MPPDSLKPDLPKPISPNLEKVHSMSKCSCFVEKIVLRIFSYIFQSELSAIVILSLCNIPSMQHYVLLFYGIRASRESLHAFFARLTRKCRKISNLIQHTRNVAKAQNYNSSKFRLKMLLKIRIFFSKKKNNCITHIMYFFKIQRNAFRRNGFRRIRFRQIGTEPCA